MPGRRFTREALNHGEHMQQVGMAEIQRIFEITDPMGIHRESLMIPLGPKNPGTVKRKPNGKFEIVVDATMDFEEWLKGLEAALRAVMV
jgi:hypothetical protein